MTSSNQKHKINHFNNTMWVTFANIFARVLYFVSSIVAARYLFPEDFGIISMALTFYNFIECSSTFGVDTFLIYKQDLSKREVNSIYILNILIAVIFSVVIFLCSKPAAIIYKTPETTTQQKEKKNTEE